MLLLFSISGSSLPSSWADSMPGYIFKMAPKHVVYIVQKTCFTVCFFLLGLPHDNKHFSLQEFIFKMAPIDTCALHHAKNVFLLFS